MLSDNSIQKLKLIDRECKPNRLDDHAILLQNLYDDSAREDVINRLQTLGMGLKDNDYPLIVGLLRRVIDRLAVVYASPPTRWLTRNGRRLSESNAQHVAMSDVLCRAQYDLAWNKADKLRALHRQVIARVYPSDAYGSVKLSIFEPYNVIRAPSPSAGALMDEDNEFALCLSKNGVKETWEHWRKVDGAWFMTWVNESGEVVSRPFESTGDVCPYSKVPIQIVYDDFNHGRPWLAPRVSRIGWAMSINAIANDLLSLIAQQAHSRQVYKRDSAINPGPPPLATGHGAIMTIEPSEDFQMLTPNPHISECENVLGTLSKLFALTEDLPANEFDSNRQILTGPALLIQEKALNQRRDIQASLAEEDERMLYERLRAVHNVHCFAWGTPELDESTELEVEVADVKQPTSAADLQKVMLADIAVGACSVIDYIQARDTCSRAVAIKTYERVSTDLEDYPAETIASQDGPRPAGVDGTTDVMPATPADMGAAEMMRTPSVVDAVAS